MKAANAPLKWPCCPPPGRTPPPAWPFERGSRKVFLSDDGSTAIEVALKLAYAFARRTGRSAKPRFLSLAGACHGDSVGAVALGHINLFHKAYGGCCSRPTRSWRPIATDVRSMPRGPSGPTRVNIESAAGNASTSFDQKFEVRLKKGNPYAAFVFEPLMQGAAGMIPQPSGWLRQAAEIAGRRRTVDRRRSHDRVRAHGVTVLPSGLPALPASAATAPPSLFACHHEGVQPDFLALAKALTEGYCRWRPLSPRSRLRGLPRRIRRIQDVLPWPQFHRQPTRRRGGPCQPETPPGDTVHSRARPARTDPPPGTRRALGPPARRRHPADRPGRGNRAVRDWRTRQPFELRHARHPGLRGHGYTGPSPRNVIVLMPPIARPGQARRMVAPAQAVRELGD